MKTPVWGVVFDSLVVRGRIMPIEKTSNLVGQADRPAESLTMSHLLRGAE